MELTDPMIIKGKALDPKTNETIVGANVYLKSDRTNSAYPIRWAFHPNH